MAKITSSYFEKTKKPHTWSGIPLNEIYKPADVKDINYERDIADAGEYPFTRGIHPNMYRGRLWTRRLGWGFGTPADTNRQFKFLLKEGNTGLALFRDLPSALGIDPDHPLAKGEVGRAGVSIASIEDMEEIFEDIPLDKVSVVVLCASAVAPVMQGLYIAVAENKGIDLKQLRGTLSNDTLHGYFCYSKEANPVDLCTKAALDVIEFCTRNMPLWNAMYINSYDLRDSGINAPQEIAFSLSIAIEYIKGAVQRGLNVDDFLPRASFYCCAGIDFFEEVAKLRAMRRLWARLTRERFGATNPQSWHFRFGAHTAGSSLVPQQPLNNIIRIAYEQMVAVLAGAQSINSCTFDEPVCLPTELSQMTALRNQQILAYETGVSAVADPLGGSYYVENLTNQIEHEAAKILEEIEGMGGVVGAIKSGWMERKIEEGLLKHQREVESGERVMVGMNAFTIPTEDDIPVPGGVQRIPLHTEGEQIARLHHLKERRDQHKLREAISRLREKAQGDGSENLMRPIIDCLKAYATLEEVQGTLRQAKGYSWDPWDARNSPF